jgi:acetylornithine deacetylase
MDHPLSPAVVLSLLQNLIRIPSVNPVLAPDEGQGESAIAAFARDWFHSQGVRAWLEEAAPGRPNVVAEVGTDNGPRLALCAHLDTVATAGMTIPPFAPTIQGNRVYGRGSYDMKGGVAAVMSAVAELSRRELTGKVVAALVADEEHASLGAYDFVKRHKADACILTEPSEGRLILGHKGFVWAEITTTGRAAHGSRWDLGISAIGKMGPIIAALEKYDRENLRQRVHPLLGPASQHCSLIRGGAGLSTYAESCTVSIERRTLPGETAKQVLDNLRHVVDMAGQQAEIKLILERPPMICDRNEPIASCLTDAAQVVTNRMPEEAGVGYWMDAAVFAAAGIPTVNYGHGGEGAHEAVEWVDLDSVVKCAEVLVEAALRFTRTANKS